MNTAVQLCVFYSLSLKHIGDLIEEWKPPTPAEDDDGAFGKLNGSMLLKSR